MKKHIVCFGDSNTHGYCADPSDTIGKGSRFTEDERWTHLLQNKLGKEYLVIEEGLSGRTTVFSDPLHESMSGLDVIYSCLMSHEPVDLLIIMLGTNDTKERFGANPACIAIGMERLIQKAKTIAAWTNDQPNILVIAPPHIGDGVYSDTGSSAMGAGCAEKSRLLASKYAEVCERQGCFFLDAEGIAEFNQVDYMHLTSKGHRQWAEKLASILPTLMR